MYQCSKSLKHDNKNIKTSYPSNNLEKSNK